MLQFFLRYAPKQYDKLSVLSFVCERAILQSDSTLGKQNPLEEIRTN